MDTYGRMFNGGFVRFNADEREHARHLLSGDVCDCAERGIRSRNGKFAAIAFSMESQDIGAMQDIELNPDDITETAPTLKQLLP